MEISANQTHEAIKWTTFTYEQNQGWLLERIKKGAEFIEYIGKDHPKYEAAMRKYDALCSQLRASIERGRGQ